MPLPHLILLWFIGKVTVFFFKEISNAAPSFWPCLPSTAQVEPSQAEQ